jgi:hypothetical protein
MLDALRFDRAPGVLPEPSGEDLAFADRTQLTPLLARFELKEPAKSHVDGALARNTIRVARVSAAYTEIVGQFERAHVEHIVLKGFTHVPAFIDDIRLRVQYDLDLYVPNAQRGAARDALLALGYEPIDRTEGLAMDHLPTMVRKTGWRWRGDYFDPDLPVAVEVHFRFWDAPTERLRVEGLDDFWARRNGARLNPIDALGYAALHLTRHLLRGNVRAGHVWELGRFLDTHRDAAFWREWQRQHSRSLRQIEAIAFLFAKSWFGCRLADEVEVEIGALPRAAHRWFELYGWSPIETLFHPNKDEVWLHLSLLDSGGDQWNVLRRRLVPASLPGPIDAIHVRGDQLNAIQRAGRVMRNTRYAASRAFYHTRMLIPTLVEGARWWFRARS